MAYSGYLQARTVKVQSCLGKRVRIANSIVAGCQFANSMARAHLYDALEFVHQRHLRTSIWQFVDDLTQYASGSLSEVAEKLGNAAVGLIDLVQGVKCSISAKSTIVIANPDLARRLRSKILRKIGAKVETADETKDFGMGKTGGTRRPRVVIGARF